MTAVISLLAMLGASAVAAACIDMLLRLEDMDDRQ
jgi:hypothetical protein